MDEKIKLPNHIEEYFDESSNKSEFVDLFEAEQDNVDLRTDLTHKEIILVNIITLNSEMLNKLGIHNDFYSRFIDNYKRLKVSMDRKSRTEFVDINKKERFENNLSKFNAFSTLQKVKE